MTTDKAAERHFIIFLQNAWSPLYAGEEWPRDSWLRALARSRSGSRLRLITEPLGHDFSICYNVARLCGPTPSSIVPPDTAHCRSVLAQETPDLVVACGRHATAALTRLWSGPLLSLPHPTWRPLRDALYETAACYIPTYHGRGSLRQDKRGLVFHDSLPAPAPARRTTP